MNRMHCRPGLSCVEWPTVGAIGACTVLWLALTFAIPHLGAWAQVPAIGLLAVLTTFHSSLQHEVLHGHPTRSARLNEALVWLPFGLFVPYRRFRALHLRHHCDDRLTDPYDDPESFYLAGRDWYRLSLPVKVLLVVNNTLAGRLTIGPALGLAAFVQTEAMRVWRGEPRVAAAWLRHLAGLSVVALWLVAICGWSLAAYAAFVAYPAMGLLMLRTYAEHQARENTAERTAIVEHGGPFSLLFLNNNLHFVHHRHPQVAWYDLPALYRAERERYLAENGSYVFRSYGEVARRFLFRVKEPVAHPLDGRR